MKKKTQPASRLLLQLYSHLEVPSRRLAAAGSRLSLRADMEEGRNRDSCSCKPMRGALMKRPCLMEDIHGCKCD